MLTLSKKALQQRRVGVLEYWSVGVVELGARGLVTEF
jgi:hypothetical protein